MSLSRNNLKYLKHAHQYYIMDIFIHLGQGLPDRTGAMKWLARNLVPTKSQKGLVKKKKSSEPFFAPVSGASREWSQAETQTGVGNLTGSLGGAAGGCHPFSQLAVRLSTAWFLTVCCSHLTKYGGQWGESSAQPSDATVAKSNSDWNVTWYKNKERSLFQIPDHQLSCLEMLENHHWVFICRNWAENVENRSQKLEPWEYAWNTGPIKHQLTFTQFWRNSLLLIKWWFCSQLFCNSPHQLAFALWTSNTLSLRCQNTCKDKNRLGLEQCFWNVWI